MSKIYGGGGAKLTPYECMMQMKIVERIMEKG